LEAVLVPVAPALPVDAAGVGVNTAPGLETQELAAAAAEDTPEGGFGLTVPLPAKLHDWTFLLVAS